MTSSTVLRAALFFVAILGVVPFTVAAGENPSPKPKVIMIVGAPGQPEFATNFQRQAELWRQTCARGGVETVRIGTGSESITNDFESLRHALAGEQKDCPEALWLVLIGHGTFDGKEARFNLRGPDVTASDLEEWLKPFHRPVVVIDTSAASAPFLNKLSATNRLIVTATRSGNEKNFTRFGIQLAEALSSEESDLDKDGQVSLLEAFITASAQVSVFYRTEGRLATEHALLDDDGDGRGTPADWFRGIRTVKKPEGSAAADGIRAHQLHLVLSPVEQALPNDVRVKRDALELEISRLRATKFQRPAEDYYREIENLLLQMAEIYGLQPE